MAKKKNESTGSALDVARKSIVKKYGEGVISKLGDHDDLKIDVISTGSIALDVALGVGGFAMGRLHEVYGPNSSGKSTLALSACMQALMDGMRVVYIDAEHALDPKLVRSMGHEVGVDPDGIELVQAFTGDENLEIAEIFMATGEVDVVVIDSVSSLIPKGMAEKEIGEDTIGLLARLMSKACLKLTPIANRTNTCLIFINQIRQNIKLYGAGGGQNPTGGEALGFYTTSRIRVSGGESQSSRIVEDDGPNKGLVIGHRSKFQIVKNKLSAPWRTAEIDLIYGKGYDFKAEVIDIAEQLGIIEQSGAWYTYGDLKVQGKRNMVNTLKDDENIYLELKNKIDMGMGNTVVLTPSLTEDDGDE